ncbi:MAG: ECF RNA polymerase sigma factor SigE [Ignavibacteria bacterium]|nr:ECF RNA polymerase sigma factor SigE [Ignavibacteria bacterium]
MPENNFVDFKSLTDEELIFRFQEGDIKAFNEIVRRYKDKIVNFVFRFCGNRDIAEDVSQETFIKLFKNKHSYKPIAKFTTWLHTIAINETKTMLRSDRKHESFSISNMLEEGTVDMELASSDYKPDSVVNTKIEVSLIQKAINELDEKYREAVVLRDIEDLDYEEISKVLEIPLGTVRSRINRGRESLRITLGKLIKKNKI